MSIVDYVGFSRRSALGQGIVLTSGSSVFSTDVPADSLAPRSYSLKGTVGTIRFRDGDNATFKAAPSGDWAYHYRYKPLFNGSGASFGNEQVILGVETDTGVPIQVYGQDDTLNVILNVGGTEFVSATPITFDAWNRIIVQKTGALYEVFLNGLPTAIVSGTVVIAGLGNVNKWTVRGNLRDHLVTDLVFMALDGVGVSAVDKLLNCTVAYVPFTGDGAVTDQTGGFGDIDEVPFNDSDFIEAGAPDELSLLTHAGLTVPEILDVKLYARVTRSGSAAGTEFQFAARSGAGGTDVFYPAAPTGAPGDGTVIVTLGPTASGGSSWSSAVFASEQFGVISRT